MTERSVDKKTEVRSDEEQPAQRKPLTDEEIAQSLEQYSDVIDPSHEFWKGITRAIEAAHGIKEKNT